MVAGNSLPLLTEPSYPLPYTIKFSEFPHPTNCDIFFYILLLISVKGQQTLIQIFFLFNILISLIQACDLESKCSIALKTFK